MIKNFEDITHDLTPEEYDLAVRLAPFLEKRTKDNPILAKQIIDGVNEKWNPKPKLTDARLRKIINYYRVQAILPVISTSKGYYVSYDEDDVNDMMQSLCQRGNSIIQASFGMGKILNKIKYKE
jgi:hypothetical protein